MKEPKIIIQVNAGVVTMIDNPDNIPVSIRDYDLIEDFIDVDDIIDLPDNVFQDEHGMNYTELGNV